MNRRKLPGVATANKRLADGTRRKYYYAWRGGPLLKADDGSPLAPNDPQFAVAYTAAHAERKRPATGTLFSLIAAYKASTEFTGRAESTQKDYRRYLKMIEEEFGTMPLNVVQDRRARGKFKEWRDGMAANPRKADYGWTVLARVLAVAKDRGLIAVNVCERGGRLYEADRAEIIWLDKHIEAFCAAAAPELVLGLLNGALDWPAPRDIDQHRLVAIRWHPHKIAAQQAKAWEKEKANRHPRRRSAESRAGCAPAGKGRRDYSAEYIRRIMDRRRLSGIVGKGFRSREAR
jgi:hypothetical protein